MSTRTASRSHERHIGVRGVKSPGNSRSDSEIPEGSRERCENTSATWHVRTLKEGVVQRDVRRLALVQVGHASDAVAAGRIDVCVSPAVRAVSVWPGVPVIRPDVAFAAHDPVATRCAVPAPQVWGTHRPGPVVRRDAFPACLAAFLCHGHTVAIGAHECMVPREAFLIG